MVEAAEFPKHDNSCFQNSVHARSNTTFDFDPNKTTKSVFLNTGLLIPSTFGSRTEKVKSNLFLLCAGGIVGQSTRKNGNILYRNWDL